MMYIVCTILNRRCIYGKQNTLFTQRPQKPYLVHVMFLTKLVVSHTHCVEHTHDVHWTQSRAHGCETDNVAEEDADRLELLAGAQRLLSVAKFIGYRLGDHVVEEFVRRLDAHLQLSTADLLLYTEREREGGMKCTLNTQGFIYREGAGFHLQGTGSNTYTNRDT